jgi:hypothetical protein
MQAFARASQGTGIDHGEKVTIIHGGVPDFLASNN